jgi:hypothetical protein
LILCLGDTRGRSGEDRDDAHDGRGLGKCPAQVSRKKIKIKIIIMGARHRGIK